MQAIGYRGRYYPINARSTKVHGQQAYPNVSSLPEPPDMVVIAIPRDSIPDVVDECARVGVKAAVILATGFVDLDAHGAELQGRITETTRKSGLLVVGPNCLGLASVANRCAATSSTPPAVAGNVALISHSGGLMNEVISCGVPRGIGFSHLVSAGNEAGVTAADYIDYFVADPGTDVILAILETARDPAGFVAACVRAAEARKPIVVLKMGWSPKGKLSAFTHTGANTGDDAVYDALFHQYGVTRVDDIDELVDMGALLAPAIDILRTRRLERAAVIEISGGGKGLVCDTAATAGVVLPDPSPAGFTELDAHLPEDTYRTNPIDTGGSWVQPDKAEVYPATLEVFATEPDVDIVVSRYTIPRTGGLRILTDRLAELETARAAHPDRLFPVLSRTCDQFCDEWEAVIRERRIPFLQGYGRGLRALGLMAQYSRFIHGPTGKEISASHSSGAWNANANSIDSAESREILSSVRLEPAKTPQRGIAVLLGAHRDVQFGPVITFALGGSIGRVLDDHAVRLTPLNAESADEMLVDIHGHELLDGADGEPPADRAAIRDALCRLSTLMGRRTDVGRIEIEAVTGDTGHLVATAIRTELAVS